MIDNIHVLTLEDSNRITSTESELSRSGVASWERFYGIHAVKMGLMTINTYEVDHPGTGQMISQRGVGMHLSHFLLWRHFNYDHTEDRFTVLEDDVRLVDGWENLSNKMWEAVPEDWDMIVFGGIYNEKDKVDKNIYKLKQFYCMHAYMIKNSDNIKKIISECLPMEKQIDSYMSDMAKEQKLNIYGIDTYPKWIQDSTINSTDIQTPVKIEKP